MSLCLLQEQQKGVEQSSRPREHGCLHHKASGGYSKAGKNPAVEMPQCDVVPQPVQQEPKTSEVVNDLKPQIISELEETLKNAQRDLAPFIQQLHIDRTQMAEAKEKQEKDKLDKILRYTRLVFLPHGFSDEELFQIEEAVKLLVQYNGIVNCVSVKIEKKKLKQTDLKNFAWNIGHQYNIDSEVLAMFVVNLFHSWFKNTEKGTIQKTLHTQQAYTQLRLTRIS